jgi:serine/threonine-protein kinase
VTTLAPQERSHRFPQLLPDGRSVIFTIKTEGILTFDDATIAIADLRTGKHRVLLEGGSYARYVPSGHLVYAREGGLLAAPFDLDSVSITGGAVPVLDGVITNSVTGAAQMDVSNNGTLVYVQGDYSGPTTLFGIDRETGAREVLAPGHYVSMPHLSPDGRRLLLHASAANDHVLSLDLNRGTVARMTDASTNNILPIWGPEGQRIIFTTDRSGKEEIVSMPTDGGEITQLIPPGGPPQDAYSFSPDGKIMTINTGMRSSRDIWIFDTEGDGEARPFLETPFDEGDPVFSPDGRWITYSSNESGTLEIYAKSFLGPGGKIQLSTGGGFYPRWRRDGAELYYQTETALMVVPVSWTPEPTPGRPQVMTEINSVTPMGYDVSPDGKRFYVVELDKDRWQSNRLDVVLNWFDELNRLAPREAF